MRESKKSYLGARGVHKLQILRDELDVDQPAGGVFEVPAIVVALLLGNGAAHLDHVDSDLRRRTRAHEDGADYTLDPRGEGR